MGPIAFTLKTSPQEAGEIASTPLPRRIEQLVRLAVEQRIYWGEAGEEAAVPDDSVLRRFVFRDCEPHPDFAVVDGAENGRESSEDAGVRILFAFRATGDPELLRALADLAGRTGSLETVPW